jgi:hypothetical protein
MYPLLFIALVGIAPVNVDVQTLSGETTTGSILALTNDQVTIERDGKPVSMPTGTITGLAPTGEKPSRAWEPGVWVELTDGTSLVGLDYQAQDGRARIRLSNEKTMEIPTRNVNTVRLRQASESLLADWARIREMDTTGDLLVVRKDTTLDYHRGVIRDVTGSVVQFELDGDVLPVKRAKVLSLVYFQSAGQTLPDAICHVTDVDGSAWAVQTIRLVNNQLEWTTPLGLTMARAWSEIVRVDFSRGKIVYLSDLEPETREWTPYFKASKDIAALSQFFAPKTDRGMHAGPILLDRKTYTKGLTLHSRTRLAYRLPDKFRRFKATVGIDDRARPQGNARLVIQGDDRVLLETTVTGHEPAKPVDLDLTGIRRLSILADYGDDLDIGDHVDLGEARVLK